MAMHGNTRFPVQLPSEDSLHSPIIVTIVIVVVITTTITIIRQK